MVTKVYVNMNLLLHAVSYNALPGNATVPLLNILLATNTDINTTTTSNNSTTIIMGTTIAAILTVPGNSQGQLHMLNEV